MMRPRMTTASSTCWSMIDAAAAGDAEQRARFALRYGPVVRATLEARRGRGLRPEEVDDLAQEVFLECFRLGGALGKAEPGRPGGFRGFFYGVVRNVAARGDQRRASAAARGAAADVDLDAVDSGERDSEAAFERAWAQAAMREAAELMDRRASSKGPAAKRRVELLHLRFHENLPVREIATRWSTDAAKLHHDYAEARKEFREALRATVAAECGTEPAETDAECARLLALLA
jgi:RNA polymerase sigma factor (sigma-70 family)